MQPNYKIKFLDKALTEIDSSWDWYEDQQYGVGDKFKTAIEEATEILLKRPFQYAVKFADYREIPLKKFPFVLVYRVDENLSLIIITSVFHIKRNPTSKYK